MIRSILFFSAVLFCAVVSADYRVTWTTPTENTDGTPLTDLDGFNLWCIPIDRTYGEPNKLPKEATEYVATWPGPAGDWKCKMQSFNTAGVTSDDSPEVFFTLADIDGDGNNDVVKPSAPDPADPGGAPLPVAKFSVTRRGYYTIIGPDGDLLQKGSEGPRRVTTRDEAYEWITSDGRRGLFVIKQPDYDIEWQ